MKYTQWISISVFVLICGGIVGLSLFGNWDGGEFRKKVSHEPITEANEESYFKDIDYFLLKKNKKSLSMEATDLTLDSQSGRTVFLKPRGQAYTDDEEPIYYEGKTGLLKEGKNELSLDGDVKMRLETSTFSSDKLDYNIDKDKLVSTGNVKSYSKSSKTGDEIEIFAERSISYPKLEKSQYVGKVRGKIIRKRVYEETVFFNSRKLDLDMRNNQIDLVDEVRIKKQSLTADAYRGEIFLENYNKRLKYFVLYDDVKVVEMVKPRDGSKPFTRRAFAEKLEGIISEGEIVLTGAPKVYQFKDVIKGNKITLRENNEVVEVDDANTKFNLK